MASKSNESLPTRKGVYLQEIDLNRTEADTDIDIIAIHGLDTKSPDTWTWKDPRDPNNKRKWVNWLGPGMLPTSVDRVRIFTCDWPADMLVPSNLIQKTIEEYALLLLEGIESALFTCETRRQDRPILFIASCLGGLILIMALVHADDRRSRYYCLRKATRGIIFLATPFRGTSFQDVAAWAEVGLKAKAFTRDRNVSRLLDSVKESTFQLEQTVSKFTLLCRDNDHPCEVFSFFELGTMSLPHKALPWLPRWLHQKKQLVNRSSATLDIVLDPLSLERPHSLMNKFEHSGCPDYKKVASRIRDMTESIRAGKPLEQADKLIRDKHYTMDRLKIERLSGKLLPIDQCYINLAILKQSGEEEGLSAIYEDSRISPFSLLARHKLNASEDRMQVTLAAIFDGRQGVDGAPIHPRRILIRGRAGVGKSTLCKKMVYDFTYGIETELHRLWKKMFDRILWIPLRRLKIQPTEGWSLESLFHHEYFKKGGEEEGRRLAKVLSQALLGPNAGRTLFILDGLDEVAGAWGYNDYRSEVLLELLNQPAVIITSRPSAILPAGVHKTDFEVETIGFCLDQVAYYIRKTFTEREKADEIWLFLQAHWLLKGLVRIPIQLDALCYIWDDLELDDIPNTMTRIYEEIELKLWKKDVVRLEKRHDDKMLLVCDLQTVDRSNIERFAKDEMFFLEGLAFTGLHNDVIDFTSKNLKDISNRFTPDLLPNKSLPLLSFLRTSDPLSEYDNQEYHFIHLTFQEYFAARYFARQWKDEGQLQIFTLGSNNAETRSRPKEFLREQKYTARYHIFWRFVAGLLDASGQSSELIRTIEEEPLDLLGFSHQRLVMYCLSETLGDLPLRKTLEERLAQWLLFECQLDETATETLASEMEFPEEALKTILLNKSHNAHATILNSLASRVTISPSIARVAMAYMSNNRLSLRLAAIRSLRTSSALPDEVLKAMAARLGDKKKVVRLVASDALSKRTALSDEVLKAIAAWLNDNDPSIRCAATMALHTHAALPDEVIEVVAERLNDKDLDVKKAAIMALSIHEALPNDTIRAITANLSDNNPDVRQEAVEVLCECVTLPVEVYDAVMARCHDENPRVQRAAVAASSRYQALPDEVFCTMLAQALTQDLDVRGAGVETFSRYIVPPDDVIPDDVIRAAAKLPTDPSRLTIVMSCEMVPENFIWPAMMWFGDEEAAMRLAATRAISMPPSESAELLIDLVPKVLATFPEVRKAVREHYSRFVELPDEALKAARLYDESEEAREAAVKTLMHSNEDLPPIISTQRHVTSIYKACLMSGFKELLSLYIEKDRCYINWQGGIGQMFPDIREHQIREWISQARPAGFPSISSGENLPEV